MLGTEEKPVSQCGAQPGFSLETRIPQPPLPSRQPRRLIWWCRVILWLSPGPAWAMIGVGLEWLTGWGHPLLAAGTAIPCAYGIGYCDAFLSPAVRKKNGTPVIKEALWHAFGFGALQLFVAPLTLVAIGIFLLVASSLLGP